MTEIIRRKPRRDGSSLKMPPQTLRLQTKVAVSLVQSKDETRNVCLYGFTAKSSAIYRAAEHDDPYADLALIQIEEALQAAKSELKEQTKVFVRLLETLNHLVTGLAEAEPVVIPLQCLNPYGFQGAWLLLDLDELLRTILTARFYGLLGREASKHAVYEGCRVIRAAYGSANLWRGTGVTRADIRANTPVAQRACAVLGDLPSDVLSGERRARNAPSIVKRGTGGKGDELGAVNVDGPMGGEV